MITDYQICPEPPLPVLPAAGGKFIDPVFKTEIMLVTDSKDDPIGCGMVYSHWPTFNANSTKLLIAKGSGGAFVKEFDPVSFTLGASKVLPNFPDSSNPGWQGLIWHNSDPNIGFVYPGGQDAGYPSTGMKLYSFDFRTNQFTLMKDFGGTADILAQVYSSEDHQVFVALHKSTLTDKVVGVVIFNRTTNTVKKIPNPFPGGIDEIHIDRSGRWAEIRAEVAATGEPHTHILDLHTNETVVLIKNEFDRPGGHGDNGFGSMLATDAWEPGLKLRKYTDPHHPAIVFPFFEQFLFHLHLSLNAVDQLWTAVSTYTDSSLSRLTPLANEIFLASLDGSKQVKRICHTRAVGVEPKGNISKDGKYIAFSSDWSGSRSDLFVARVETIATLPPVITTPTRSALWPKQQGKHKAILDAQWREGYRLMDDNLDGDWAMFEKVK